MKPTKPVFLINVKLISTITLLILFATLSEELTNVKVIGGFSTECSENNPGPLELLQPLVLNVVSSKKSGTTLNAEFEIEFVECIKGKWVKLKSMKTEVNQDITDEMKQKINEKSTFSQLRVHVQDTKGKTIQTHPLSIGTIGKIRFKIKVNSLDIATDPESRSKYVDLVLVSDRTRKTSADYFFEEVNWGRVRLPLEKPPK